jgi:hypothetical protein
MMDAFDLVLMFALVCMACVVGVAVWAARQQEKRLADLVEGWTDDVNNSVDQRMEQLREL